MMKEWQCFEKEYAAGPRQSYLRRKKGEWSNDIFSFDIETTSLFYVDGAWHSFDYSKKPDYYSGVPKAGTCYIWMFGWNDNTYYGRDIKDFKKILEVIHRISNIPHIIWIHNLSFEFQWLQDVIGEYTFTEMVARSPLKPISFKLEELNIYFRCSYMLTNLSLENAAKKYTSIRKAAGDLDYIPLRGMTTPLTGKELYYCEMDIRTVTEIIRFYSDKYGGVGDIPLTSTGEVRKALNSHLDYFYHQKMWKLIPPPNMYMILMESFAGGLTHGNILNSMTVWRVGENCQSLSHADETSAYPTMLLAYKYPSEPFWSFDPDIYDLGEFKKSHCFIFKVTFTNLKSKYYNHYISINKMYECTGAVVKDNGRLVSCSGSVTMYLTNIDLEIIEDAYTFDEEEYNHIWASRAQYLDKRVLLFILEQYENKTKLKGYKAEDPEEQNYYDTLYMNSKAILNGIFGMSCTNALKSGVTYNQKGNNWEVPDITFDYIEKKIGEMEKSYSIILFYAVGVFC